MAYDRTGPLRRDSLGLDIGGATIVADVSLEVAEGEFIGVIGPNGAGKTSFFNLLSGLTRPTAGRISVDGEDITHTPPYARARAGLGRTFQVSSVFPRLSGSRTSGSPPRRRSAARCGCGGVRRHSAGGSSGPAGPSSGSGSQRPPACRRRALRTVTSAGSSSRWCSPATRAIVLLDEPMAGVSAENVHELVEVIRTVHGDERKTRADGRAPHRGRHRPRRADRGHAPRPRCSPATRPRT